MEIMASSARCCTVHTIAHVRIVANKQLENLEYVCYLVVAWCVLPESVSITLQLGLCSFRMLNCPPVSSRLQPSPSLSCSPACCALAAVFFAASCGQPSQLRALSCSLLSWHPAIAVAGVSDRKLKIEN